MKPPPSSSSPPRSGPLVSADFVVHGKVQGVFFRKYTYERASALDLVGHVRNVKADSERTVAGVVQGREERVNEMKRWLETTGSPSSRVSRVEWGVRAIGAVEYSAFSIRPTTHE